MSEDYLVLLHDIVSNMTINDGLRAIRCPLSKAEMICTYGAINLRDGKNFEAQLGQEFGLRRIRLLAAQRQQAREGLGWCSAGKDQTDVQFLLAKGPALDQERRRVEG